MGSILLALNDSGHSMPDSESSSAPAPVFEAGGWNESLWKKFLPFLNHFTRRRNFDSRVGHRDKETIGATARPILADDVSGIERWINVEGGFK